MEDKWIKAEAFNKRVDEVEAVLKTRWEHVHLCDVVHGFFYCYFFWAISTHLFNHQSISCITMYNDIKLKSDSDV